MTDGKHVVAVPRHDPVNANTMAVIVRGAGLTPEAFRNCSDELPEICAAVATTLQACLQQFTARCFLKGIPSKRHTRTAMLQQRATIALLVTAGLPLIAAAQEPDRPADLDRIRSVVIDLNKARRNSDAKAFSQLFDRDGTLRVGNQIIATGPDAIEKALKGPHAWSEVTPPKIGHESVRFVSADVALVDATQTRYGSLILKQSAPVTLLLKLDSNRWRIVSLWLQPLAATPSDL